MGRGIRVETVLTAALLAALVACGPSRNVASPPPSTLLLISMDGFRSDYIQRVETPNLDRVIASGVRAAGLTPPFPSKTFPSHYTLVTGLYPGHHGIISNNIRDPRWPESFGLSQRREVEDGRWWGGEPIWVAAQRQGLRSAVYFWPGSEAAIRGVRPTYWHRFDASVSFEARVDQALEWIDLPANARPSFVALYFGEPNDSGHRYGPLAGETLAAVRRVDAMIGRLLDGLDERGLHQSTNIVLVADHGMAQMDAERVILVDDLVALDDDEVFEQGALLQLFPRPGREALIYDALAGAHPNLHVYRRDELPERLHLYDHPRLPPILATPDVGWEVVTRSLRDRWGDGMIAGDHGQDPEHPDMQAIFAASGPAFASGVTVPAIEAVDVYDLLAAALGIDVPDNDGDPARALGILR